MPLQTARRGTLSPTIGGNVKAVERTPGTELHLWRARLDCGGWPGADGLPAPERRRAGELVRERPRARWVASRWALRSVLGRYLERDPAEIELLVGERGKPLLADGSATLRFNLSHSGELATIAVADGLEVGVDVQRVGGRPAGFYAEWTRREAVAKCLGVGLWAPLPDAPVAVANFDPGVAGFAAAVAVGGSSLPPLRRFTAEPERADDQ